MKIFTFITTVYICFIGTVLTAQEGYRKNSKPILSTNFVNKAINVNDTKWTSKICSGKTWLKDDPPRFEWTPAINPNDEFSSIVGLSGVALYAHESQADMPFTHPFGFDYNYLIVPDKDYENLLGPNNGILDEERTIANSYAKNSGIKVNKGFLGVEQDKGLLPNEFRVSNFNRVAVFGRWIVDCGHDNFLTEIHPPLLTVFADGSGNTDVPTTLDNSVTRSKIISLPYLVSQNFENGSLRDQILGELTKANLGPSTIQMKTKPTILKPFTGLHIFQFTVRPPILPNALYGVPNKYELFAEYQFTVRDGISIQIAPDGSNGVLVTVVMNDVNFKKDENTLSLKRKDYPITPNIIGQLDNTYGQLFKGVVGGTVFINPNPAAAIIINKGFLSDLYEPLTIPNNAITHKVFVKNLKSNTPVTVNNTQPFPIYGFLNLSWKKEQKIEKPDVVIPTGYEDQYLSGDWDGDGKSNIAVRRGNQIIMDFNFDGIADRTQVYGNGNAEDQYLVGDWDGDGKSNIAVRRGNQIIMDFNFDGNADRTQVYGNGNAEDQYLAGDWDGDGKDNIAVRRGNQIIMDFNFDGIADRTQIYGNGINENQYLVGDWNGDKKSNIAVRRNSAIIMDFNFDGVDDQTQVFGNGKNN
jgi:hypothetical protein